MSMKETKRWSASMTGAPRNPSITSFCNMQTQHSRRSNTTGARSPWLAAVSERLS